MFLPHDAEVIKAIKIPTRQREDIVAWHYEKSGIFTVRSTYRLAIRLEDMKRSVQGSSSSPWGVRSLWNKVWKLQVPEKVRIFIWRANVGNHECMQYMWNGGGIGVPCTHYMPACRSTALGDARPLGTPRRRTTAPGWRRLAAAPHFVSGARKGEQDGPAIMENMAHS